ncbi:MAG TPA: 2OG-Fe(II) oxygenase [Chryseosolibacter sp.]
MNAMTIETDARQVAHGLDTCGFALVNRVLSSEACDTIRDFYEQERLFRSTINMQRYRFGLGEYKYFDYPLPSIVQSLRENFYEHLVPLANEWMSRLGLDTRYPGKLDEFLALCHSKNQRRPTPLVLRYESGGFNTLHQDIYGEVYFPFQVVFVLTERGRDYEGGELVFVEQLPRAQSRAEVIAPGKGDAVIFTTNFRPVKGSKGYYRAKMKHGVSPVRKGTRYTMGLIFHDAA